MDVTRLSGVALASALMFACAGRVAPGAAASTSGPEEDRPPAAAEEVRADPDGQRARTPEATEIARA